MSSVSDVIVTRKDLCQNQASIQECVYAYLCNPPKIFFQVIRTELFMYHLTCGVAKAFSFMLAVE